MHEIKYRGKRNLARHMGMLSRDLAKIEIDSYDAITAVPLHRARQKSRGYNQAEWFARGFIGTTSTPALRVDLLERTRNTKTQTKLDKADRKANVRDAFRVVSANKAFLSNSNVLLVDDVVTTGATTGICAQALLNAGCRNVDVLSLARD